MTNLRNPLLVDKEPPANKVEKHPDAVARESRQQEEKSEELALEIVKVVASMHPNGSLSKDDFAAYCETIWQWTVTDTWPPK